jgi:hypothetical protein
MILSPFDAMNSQEKRKQGRVSINQEKQGLEPSVQLKQGKEGSAKKAEE